MKRFNQRQRRALERIATKTPTIHPFAGDTPKAKEKRIQGVLEDDWNAFATFSQTYFPHIFPLPFCPAHEDMFRHTHKFNGINGITGFRELGKTVLMGIVYPIWRLVKGDTFIVHVAADAELASVRSMFTHHELGANRRLLVDFPHLRPTTEDPTAFFTTSNAWIIARGIRSSFRGLINPRNAKRPDVIVCDDIDQEQNQGNQSIGRRKLRKIVEEIGGAIATDSDAVVIFLGNLVHPNYSISMLREEILAEIRQDDPEFMPGHNQALITPQRKLLAYSLENPDGTSAWEEKYPTASLPEVRQRFGSTGYQREMLGIAVIDGNIFKNEWFTYYSTPPKNSQLKRVWLYSDPAWGQKGCFKAVVAIGYDGFQFYTLRVWVRQVENSIFFQYLHDALTELKQTYGARFRSAIETSFGQARLLQDFDRWCQENHLPPISHWMKQIDNRENKNLRIEATETSIQSGRVLFPVGQDMPTLRSQFLTYPDGYIDGPDAFAGCLERFHEYAPRHRVRIRRFSQ